LKIWDTRIPLYNENEESYGGATSTSLKPQKVEDYVNGIDWNYHEVGLIALCCNDHLTKAYNIRED
jgi:hypothetical protein